MVTIAERIRERREALKVSQKAFGERATPPIRGEHIAHYEMGQIPSPPVLERLAAAAGVTVAELVDGVSFARVPREGAPRRRQARQKRGTCGRGTRSS